MISILSAMGGRYGWRWWLPLALWLGSAALAGVSRSALGQVLIGGLGLSPYSTWMIAILGIWPVLIWGLGARAALALGHSRSGVFGVAGAASLAAVPVAGLLMSAANQIELMFVSVGDPRIFVFQVGDKFATDESLWSVGLPWLLTGALPILLGVSVTVCAAMRWGWPGVLLGAVVGALGFVLSFAAFIVVMGLPGPAQGVGQSIAAYVVGMGLLAVAWAAFRKQPV